MLFIPRKQTYKLDLYDLLSKNSNVQITQKPKTPIQTEVKYTQPQEEIKQKKYNQPEVIIKEYIKPTTISPSVTKVKVKKEKRKSRKRKDDI